MGKRISDIVSISLQVLIITSFLFLFVYASLTYVWGKNILLIRSGISESNILYELKKESGSLFLVYQKKNVYGLIEASPNSFGGYELYRNSHKYTINLETGEVVITIQNKRYRDGRTTDARKENARFDSYYYYSNYSGPAIKYIYFGLNHNDDEILSSDGSVLQPQFSYSLGDGSYLYYLETDEFLKRDSVVKTQE